MDLSSPFNTATAIKNVQQDPNTLIVRLLLLGLKERVQQTRLKPTTCPHPQTQSRTAARAVVGCWSPAAFLFGEREREERKLGLPPGVVVSATLCQVTCSTKPVTDWPNASAHGSGAGRLHQPSHGTDGEFGGSPHAMAEAADLSFLPWMDTVETCSRVWMLHRVEIDRLHHGCLLWPLSVKKGVGKRRQPNFP